MHVSIVQKMLVNVLFILHKSLVYIYLNPTFHVLVLDCVPCIGVCSKNLMSSEVDDSDLHLGRPIWITVKYEVNTHDIDDDSMMIPTSRIH